MKGYVDLYAVPLRAEPTDKAEMVSQVLSGETVEVIERQERWSLVGCSYDGYRGWIDNKQYTPFSSAASLAKALFLDTPYLWGGRSTRGIDCSGLVQVCFKAREIWLPRDASQQVRAGYEVCLCDVQEDDLAFFCNEEGRVVHVGICTGDGHIVHSSGRVRVDVLDSQGIYVEKAEAYSHRLHSVRRLG